jgi:hypothetical protein
MPVENVNKALGDRAGVAYHARLHGSDGPILGVMRNVGRTVEKVVDAMTGVLPDNGTAGGTSDGLTEFRERRQNVATAKMRLQPT